MSQDNEARLHVYISGRVQAVGFRMFTIDAANQLGLVGWVRNLHDGDVEIVAEGERKKLETFLQKVRQGPPAAHVTEVRQNWDEPGGKFNQFSVAPTV